MSSGTDRREAELPLFDLPLRDDADGTTGRSSARQDRRPPKQRPPAPPPENLALFEDDAEEDPGPAPDGDASAASGPPGLADRVVSGLADLGVQVLALGAGILGTLWLRIPLDATAWPAFAGLGLSFSFLYWVVPLAFWGRTPGMAWLGQVARTEDDGPLSFGQATWRWIGALLTVGLVGLPQVLAFRGRTLSDRISSSRVLVEPARA